MTSFLSPYIPHCALPKTQTAPRCSTSSPQITFDPANPICYLASRSLGDAGAHQLALAISQSSQPCATTLLNLDSNRITSEGAVSLAKIALPSLPQLEELLLWDNEIGDEGACAIAEFLGKEECNVRVLNVARNKIGEDGGGSIGRCLKWNRSLETIYMMGMNKKGGGMGDAGAMEWVGGVRENVKNGGRLWFVNMDGNEVSERVLGKIKDERGAGRMVVFPADPYPGYNSRR